MKIKILGSGGGEGFPAMFCSCEHCEMARKAGGKSIRSLSQTIINDDLLIDFPNDTGWHCGRVGVNLWQLQNVLITHAHSDHFVSLDLRMRVAPFAHKIKYENICFYGPKNLQEIYLGTINAYGETPVTKNVQFISMNDQETYSVGDYSVTSLKANHAPNLGSLNYIIDDGKKSVLYLVDSGYPTEETLAFLETFKKPFDCVVMDATMGVAAKGAYIYHMGFEENKLLKEELIKRGICNENTRFVITHITHNKAETHDVIERIFDGTGIDVAYDGYEIEL